jgi:hypothetical protein
MRPRGRGRGWNLLRSGLERQTARQPDSHRRAQGCIRRHHMRQPCGERESGRQDNAVDNAETKGSVGDVWGGSGKVSEYGKYGTYFT